LSTDLLNMVAEGGNMILYEKSPGAYPTIRDQLTTDMSSELSSEASIVVNADYISYTIKDSLDPYKGTQNINQDYLDSVKLTVVRVLDYFKSKDGGERIVDYEDLTVTRDGKCTIVKATLTMAVPGKYIKVYLSLSI